MKKRLLTASISLALSLNAFAANGIHLEAVGTYKTGVFDQSAAEIAAHDPKTQRLFVVNANNGLVDVLDINNPANPTLLGSIDVKRYADPDSEANSVDVRAGVVAVAVQAGDKTEPGQAMFFDVNGRFLNAVQVGALPDMITFTPNGRKVLVANEGEPDDSYTIDPEGSVSVIDLSRGVDRLKQSDVMSADFSAFNNAVLDPAIRIFGPGATVAQDLEPEYIAVSADSRLAWVTLQENNALAVVDIERAQVLELLPLGTKDHSGAPGMSTYEFTNLPVLGVTAAGDTINLGGFSGLYFEGVNPASGGLRFITHPDRGPNADTKDVDGDGIKERPFPLPDFQAQWVRFELNPASGQLSIVERVGLTRDDGVTPISGLPNLEGPGGLAYADEQPIDLMGNPLPYDPFGADLEGIVRAPDGTYWMADEYRPSIYHFGANGRLLKRFVPQGSNAHGAYTGVEAFPAVYAQRRSNRGFEGIAYHNGLVYAFVQSPIDNPDVANDANSKASVNTRILAFDTASETTVAEYLYVLEGNGSDKIGDALAIGDNEFFVIERDSIVGSDSQKKIFRIDLSEATDLSTLPAGIAGPGGTLEGMNADELAANGIKPVRKEMAIDLAALGYDFSDKAEGLALVDNNTLAVINDNDFGLAGGFDETTGLLDPNPAPQPVKLALVHFQSEGLDASNKDDAIDIRPWPVKGMYLPDAIAAYTVRGRTFLITANEGDSRDYGGYSEETRVKDLTLDPAAFPNAAALQAEDALGRLKTTIANGDTDGDGDVDEIYAFGARSFSIWTADGQQVYDSGEDIERITAAALPADFNANNDENGSFDDRSDDKGPEPEGVTIGRINGRDYAFIGLERVGGIMVYDVSNPRQPQFVQYINNRNFAGDPQAGTAGDLGPEGVLFIAAKDSPSGEPMLVVANEVSGSTTLYRIATEK